MAQQLHQQPGGIAARTSAALERGVGGLHPRLHADLVADVLVHHLVQLDQKVIGGALAFVYPGQAGFQAFGQRVCRQIGGQFRGQQGFVPERELFGLGLQKIIKRVVYRHLDHDIHRDFELACFLGEHQARLVVGERVLLPIDKMLGRLDLERKRQYLGATVGGRAQAHDLRPQLDQTVVAVVGLVGQRDVNGHGCGISVGKWRNQAYDGLTKPIKQGTRHRFGRRLIRIVDRSIHRGGSKDMAWILL